VQEGNEKIRLDSSYFDKEALHAAALLHGVRTSDLGTITSTLRKGIFDIKADTYVEEGEGIPFVRIGDMKSGLIEPGATAWISNDTHKKEGKTCLNFGDIAISKTAYPAASFINLPECNVSQDVIAVRLSPEGSKEFKSGFITSYLNSDIGLPIMKRFFQGNVQQHLSLDDAKKIKLPKISIDLQIRIDSCVRAANSIRETAGAFIKSAESQLLSSLGLATWSPPEPLTYVLPESKTISSNRLDAQFFAPRIQQLLTRLSADERFVGSVAIPRKERFDANKLENIDYIEIGDLDGTGTTRSNTIPANEAPSRATWIVRSNDIVTSTVRPIRRLSAQITPSQDGFVCSSGFVVLIPSDVQAELLLTFLRLPIICELMDLFSSASMYPAVSETDILGLPFPVIDHKSEMAVVGAVRRARAARARANELLDAAKRTVELAIGSTEAKAFAFLKDVGDV
jgi:hypothetical protein